MRRTLSTTLLAGMLTVGAAFPALACPPDTAAASQRGPSERTTIVDKALEINEESGEFSQLIAAVTALDLVGTLDGQRQFTVFAPTDQAFQDLYDELDVDDLDGLVDELGVDAVRDVVLYHVAPGERLSGDVVSSQQINTLTRGARIPVEVDGDTVHLDEATLLTPDVDVDNGVIHVIDAVMLP